MRELLLQLFFLAARIPYIEMSLCSLAILQIGTHVALWWCVSFLLFWLVDVLDSVRLDRGGKVQLKAVVCGYRVGFSGETIHFGTSGCRCIGRSKDM